MKLIESVTISPKSIISGIPFSISVKTNNVGSKIYVKVNDCIGSKQFLTFKGKSGTRRIDIIAFSEDRKHFESKNIEVNVKANKNLKSIELISKFNLDDPKLLDISIYAERGAVDHISSYFWEINEKVKIITERAAVQCNIKDFVKLNDLYTTINIKLKNNTEGKTKTVLAAKSIYLFNDYYFNKLKNLVFPEVRYDFLIKEIFLGSISIAMTIVNVEKFDFNFTELLIEYLSNDPEASPKIEYSEIAGGFKVEKKNLKNYSHLIPLKQIPADIFGFKLSLMGEGADIDRKYKIVAIGVYEFAVQMRKITRLPDHYAVDNNPIDNRPWLRRIRLILEDDLPNVAKFKDNELIKFVNQNRTLIQKLISDSSVSLPKTRYYDLDTLSIPKAIKSHFKSGSDYINVNSETHLKNLFGKIGHQFAQTRSIHTVQTLGIVTSTNDFVGQECSEADEPPIDNLICQLTQEERYVLIPARIPNAKKGDIILSVGGPAGFIGALLNALTPPQWYSHCGIMVNNYHKLRSSTASPEWAMNYPAHGGSDVILDGEPRRVPTDGFEADKMKYMWPGTITQTIEEAFVLGSYLDDPEGNKDIQGYVHRYKIRPFSFDEAGKGYIKPMVVKPHPQKEFTYPNIRKLLKNIADKVISINSHYRFFCYSNGAIGLRKDYEAPPGLGWLRDENKSIPSVCSTLIWTAIKQVFQEYGILESSNLISYNTDLEANDKQKGGKIDPLGNEDGLYFYSEEERKAAAVALETKLIEEIHSQVPKDFAWMVECLVNMEDNIVNQFCNTFAFDFAGADADNNDSKDSDKWKNPGTGISVSPDDILNFWDEPDEQFYKEGKIKGLYGFHEPIVFRPARVEKVYIGRWIKKPVQVGKLYGRTIINKQPAPFVDIVSNAIDTEVSRPFSDENGQYNLVIPVGEYYIRFSKFNQSDQLFYETRKWVSIKPMEEHKLDVELLGPPFTRRRIEFGGHINIVDYELIGGGGQTKMIDQPAIFLDPFDSTKWVTIISKGHGEFRVEVPIQFHLQPNGDVIIDYEIKLFEGTSEDTDDLDGKISGHEVVPRDSQIHIVKKVTNVNEDTPEDYTVVYLYIYNRQNT